MNDFSTRSNSQRGLMVIATLAAGVLAVAAPSMAAAAVILTFDVSVTSCTASGATSCLQNLPTKFTEVIKLDPYQSTSVRSYDFGGGSGMLKTIFGGSTVSAASPFLADVLNASGLHSSDVGHGYQIENAAYSTNGIQSSSNIGDLQLTDRGVRLDQNEDGTYNYKNYYSGMYIDYSGLAPDIVEITPEVLSKYLSLTPTVAWKEWGTNQMVPSIYSADGEVTVSSLSYSGTATFRSLSTGTVPTPATPALLLLGLIALGLGRRRPGTKIP